MKTMAWLSKAESRGQVPVLPLVNLSFRLDYRNFPNKTMRKKGNVNTHRFMKLEI